MDTTLLPTLPISFMTALVSLLLMVMNLRSGAGNRASRICFSLLFGVFCPQALLVGLRFGYGFQALAPLQGALPFAIGPLAFLGFRARSEAGPLSRWTFMTHATAAGLPMFLLWLTPLLTDPSDLPAIARNITDLLIALSFIVYLVLLIRLYRRGRRWLRGGRFRGDRAGSWAPFRCLP